MRALPGAILHTRTHFHTASSPGEKPLLVPTREAMNNDILSTIRGKFFGSQRGLEGRGRLRPGTQQVTRSNSRVKRVAGRAFLSPARGPSRRTCKSHSGYESRGSWVRILPGAPETKYLQRAFKVAAPWLTLG